MTRGHVSETPQQPSHAEPCSSTPPVRTRQFDAALLLPQRRRRVFLACFRDAEAARCFAGEIVLALGHVPGVATLADSRGRGGTARGLPRLLLGLLWHVLGKGRGAPLMMFDGALANTYTSHSTMITFLRNEQCMRCGSLCASSMPALNTIDSQSQRETQT